MTMGSSGRCPGRFSRPAGPPSWVHVRSLSVVLVGEDDSEAVAKERLRLQDGREACGAHLVVVEVLWVGPEPEFGSGVGLVRPAQAPERFGDLPVGELQAVDPAFAPDVDDESRGERVDDAHADAVQAP